MSSQPAPVEVRAACVGCGACIATCPERAFRAVRAAPPLIVLAQRCTACLACVEVCPADAIAETSR